MKLLLILPLIMLSGCVTATYERDANSESFKVTSMMKSVDGLYAERADGFKLKVDKTHSTDSVADVLAIMKALQEGG